LFVLFIAGGGGKCKRMMGVVGLVFLFDKEKKKERNKNYYQTNSCENVK